MYAIRSYYVEEFCHATFGNFINDILRFAFTKSLLTTDLEFFGYGFGRNIIFIDCNGIHGSYLHGYILCKLFGNTGLTETHEGSQFVTRVNIRLDERGFNFFVEGNLQFFTDHAYLSYNFV